MKRMIAAVLVMLGLFCPEDLRAAAQAASAEGFGSRYGSLTATQMARIPVMFRGYAEEFCREIGPFIIEEEPRNPYVMYLEGAIFGKAFGLIDEDTCRILEGDVLIGLLTKGDSDFHKSILAAGLGVKDFSSLLLKDSLTSLEESLRDFLMNFWRRLEFLANRNNIYANFALGFIEFEKAMRSDHGTSKAESEYYFLRSAEGLCPPALDILELIYKQRGEELSLIRKKKNFIESMKDRLEDAPYIVKLAIEEDVFGASLGRLANPHSGVCCPRRVGIEESLAIYRENFIKSFFLTLTEEEKICFERLRSFLVDQTNYFVKQNKIIRNSLSRYAIFIHGPLIADLYLSLSLVEAIGIIRNQDSSEEERNGATTITICNSIAIIGSCMLTLWGIYEDRTSPFFTFLTSEEREDQIHLASLYGVMSKAKTRESTLVLGHQVYDKWLLDCPGFRVWLGWERPKTLSQLALSLI